MSIQGFQFEGDSTLYKYDYNALDNKLELDDTLEDGNKAANAEKVGDELATKANIDGYYEDLTSGNAEQLVSTQYLEDKIPYHFRTSGGSLDIGNREEDMLVGGSIVWNQFANLKSRTMFGITVSKVNESTIRVTGTISRVDYGYLDNASGAIAFQATHVYIVWVNGPSSASSYFKFYQGTRATPDILNSPRIFKYTGDSVGNCIEAIATGDVDYTFHWNKIDLTAMFGTEVADAVYAMEQAEEGAGVAWFKKLFPNDYYEYNAGELMHVEGLQSHDMVGFNLFDESQDGETNSAYRYFKIPIGETDTLWMTLKDKGTSVDLSNISMGFVKDPANANAGNRWVLYNGTYNANNAYNNSKANPNDFYSYVFVYPRSIDMWNKIRQKYDICINLSDPSRNGTYEPYVKHSYPLDNSLTLRGIPKIDVGGNLYYDGDTYESDGTVTRRYGIVDLGTLSWTVSAQRMLSNNALSEAPAVTITTNKTPNAFCAKYEPSKWSDLNINHDKTFGVIGKQIMIMDSAYTDATAFKAAMSGVYLVYELATPTTETAQPYTALQTVDASGTEEYVTTSIVPVGHYTKYPANLRDKIQHLPDLASDEGNYIINQQGQKMTLVRFRIPSAPSEDGTYILRATVSNGTPTYTWESEASDEG